MRRVPNVRKQPLVVAICGRKRSGKNTLASALLESYPDLYTTEMSFAEPIKRCVSDLFSLVPEQVHGDAKDAPDPRWDGVTPREIMQFFGTEMMQFKIQELLPNTWRRFWSRCLVTKAKEHLSREKGGIIVTDMRFLHEYQELKTAFGCDFVSVRVDRPPTAAASYRDSDRANLSSSVNDLETCGCRESENSTKSTHISETEQLSIPVDLEIKNDEAFREAFCKKSVKEFGDRFGLFSLVANG